ncbi:MAG: SDR family NAD(P)-dependent oxidoreductase [Bacteroidales bacterium]
MNTSGLWALVTGASSGIGWQFSELLAAKGCNIIAVSNQSTRLESLKRHLEQSHAVQVVTISQDLAREDAAQSLFAICQDQKLTVDILVNNAGMLMFGEMVDSEYDTMRSILQLHVTTPALLCRLFGKVMKEKRSGYILNVSSISAVMPYPTISTYGPTKAFLRYFTRAIRTELKPYGVHVSCMIPGATDTPLNNPFEASLDFWRKIGIVKEAAFVARAGIRAMFRNRALCIPGVINKLIILLFPLIPAFLISMVNMHRIRKVKNSKGRKHRPHPV